MIYRYLRVAAFLTAILSVAVAAALLVQFDDSRLASFMADPENCAGTCLLGIHTGTTTVGEAIAHLRSHVWVVDVELYAPGTGYGHVDWQWNGEQPDLIDHRYPGRLTFYWDVDDLNRPGLLDTPVQTISIYTKVRMFDFLRWFGAPDSGAARFEADGRLEYAAAYLLRDGTVSLSTVMACPVNLATYWNARTHLMLSIDRGTSPYIPMLQMVSMC